MKIYSFKKKKKVHLNELTKDDCITHLANYNNENNKLFEILQSVKNRNKAKIL